MAERKISKTTQRRVAAVLGAVEGIQKAIVKLDEKALLRLFRRDEVSAQPDGYPASSMPEHSSGSRSHHSPTESPFMARLPEKGPDKEKFVRDEVSTAIGDLEKAVFKAEQLITEALDSIAYVGQIADATIGRQAASNPCEICAVRPVEKAAWCGPCYQDWWNHGKPDRLLWKMFKTEEKNSEKILLVPECPPPLTGTAIRGPWVDKEGA